MSVALVAGLIAVGAWALKSRDKSLEVEVALVRVEAIEAPFTAEGVVKGQTVEVEPEMSGRIVRLYVSEGDTVKAGGPLVGISFQELDEAVAQAKATLDASQQRVEEAQHGYDLTKRRVEAAIIEAEAAHRVAVAQLDSVLAGPRPEEVAQAEQRVRQAESAEGQARTERERAQRLYDQSAISLADLQRAITAHETAQAQTKIARDALEILKRGATEEERNAARSRVDLAAAAVASAQANREQIDVAEHALAAARSSRSQASSALRAAQAALSKSTVRAPFAGTVSYLPTKVGDLASPGKPLLTLVGDGELTVEAEVGDQDFAKVQVGQKVEVTLAAQPGSAIPGTVTKLASEAVQKPGTMLRTRVLRATVRLDEGSALLRPGMEVDVHGQGTVADEALTVPSSAVQASGEEQSVWLVRDGKAERRAIKVGAYTFDRVQVLEGLSEGDTVVVSGDVELSEGQAVTIKGQR